MRIYLLDANQQPVPIGIPGEIYIGGIGVARGYLNRPELTAEKFIADPFRSIQEIREGSTLDNPVFGSLFYGDRLYRTGDLARYLPDGNLEFMGRVDFQVKIRGFRIELEEIESIINQHVLVQQAAVIARGGKGDEKRLIAYLVPEPGASVSINQLRTYLRQFLPEYMVPASFVILDTLPLNTNGKVDRKALPDINGTRPDLEAAYVPPQTELERVIAAIWQEVLNIEKVGLNDNFFDLGGHSLLLFKVHTRLEEALSRSVSMVDLFRYPTVSALADYLNREPQDRPKLKKSIDRADQQKDAMKRQVDRMREIANTRTSKARDAASKRTSQDQKTTSDKKPGDPGKK
jgi:acyl carrier protein